MFTLKQINASKQFGEITDADLDKLKSDGKSDEIGNREKWQHNYALFRYYHVSDLIELMNQKKCEKSRKRSLQVSQQSDYM